MLNRPYARRISEVVLRFSEDLVAGALISVTDQGIRVRRMTVPGQA